MTNFTKNLPFQILTVVILMLLVRLEASHVQEETSLRDCRCEDIIGKTNGPCARANHMGWCRRIADINEEEHGTVASYHCECYDLDINQFALRRLPQWDQYRIMVIREQNRLTEEWTRKIQRELQWSIRIAELEEEIVLEEKLAKVRKEYENHPELQEKLALARAGSENRLRARVAGIKARLEEAKQQHKIGFTTTANSPPRHTHLRPHTSGTRTLPSNSSCLKTGTKILMVDLTEKPVELLQVGDIIMDMDLKPTRVLGVAHEFLLDQKFFGFDNQSFFFTNNHIFAGPFGESELNFKLYAKSTKTLFHNNPLMKYLNVSDMDEFDSLKLFHFDEDNSALERKNVAITQDPLDYPPETPIYFIQVDSPTGTYFANGYVCRHEIPPVEYWPNTMSILFRLMGTKTFENLTQLPYNIETVSFIQNGVSQVAVAVKQVLEETDWGTLESGNDQEIMSLNDVNVDECLGKIFSNPTLSTAGVGLYARVGEIVAAYLDVFEVGRPKFGRGRMGKIQYEIYQVINDELEKLLKLVK